MPIKNLNSITVGQSTGIDISEIAWNPDEQTFDMGLANGVVLQAGHEMYFYGKASEAISNGDAVQFNGAQGSHLLVKKAVQSEINANPQYFIGVSTQDLSIGEFGYFTVFGKVRDLDTTVYRDGDPSSEGKILYFDSAGSTAGALTITPPVAPNAKIEVAAVVYDHAIQGTILVRPTIAPMLEELQDFHNNGKADGSIMVWDDTNEYWFDDDTVTIDYTNGNVGIGAASPAAKLDVNGNIHLSDLSGLQQITGGNGNIISFDNTSFEYVFGSDIIKANPANGTFSMDLFSGAPFLSYDAASLVMDLSPNFGSSLIRLDGPNGRVGIGTTSPGAKLGVYETTQNSPTLSLTVGNSGETGNDKYQDIDFWHNSFGDTRNINTIRSKMIPGWGGEMQFWTMDSADDTLKQRVAIDTDGNVGIGTTSPSQKLDVVGKINLNDGGNSVFIGTQAGLNDDTSDNRNVGVGYRALYYNTTGYYNTANGYAALHSNTGGNFNNATGYAALYSNTTGYNNTANGGYALFSNTTGYRNTANGSYALHSNTTGYLNTASGYQALYSNTTGVRNVANGGYALFSNTTAGNNTAVGYMALYNTTIMGNNTAIGTYSLLGNIGGSYNTANGVNAGRYIADGSTANTTGDYNVFLGANTKALADNDQNEIVIGYNATGLGSNSVVLGNDSITTTALKGNVGIGTTSPSYTLDVNGTGRINGITFLASGATRSINTHSSAGLLQLNGGTSSTNGAHINIAGDSYASGDYIELVAGRTYIPGNVGIGTISPGSKLEVNGDSVLDGDVIMLRASDGGRVFHARGGDDIVSIGDIDGVVKGAVFTVDYNTPKFIFENGSVAINNTSPAYKLDVTGDGRFTDDVRANSFITTSDSTLKDSIVSIDTKKTSISFKEYVFKDDTSGRKRYGVIADEVVKDHPELVHYNEKGEAGVDYISLLVKKVAELEAENNSLQEQINIINERLGIKK